ncbi:basic salivary proline-rich protein 1-like [Bacillus rossius redtenbacheri]|uniref:basic salivary proline-rich protein 1-like n=1 Tax=Bacillus rossius redtenbacheri TaxID=93214 RepID=UPI002FDD1111
MLARPAMLPQCAGEAHCANFKGCQAYKKETRRHLPPDVRKRREQQSRRDVRENRRAAAQPPQSGPSGYQGPPRQNPWGPPRYPPPATFGQYMAQAGVNPWTPLQQCSQGYNELEYPVLANNPWLRKPRGPQGPKKNATGHKNGQGKPQQPPQERAQQPAREKQPAQPKPLATRLAPAAPAQRTPPPRQPQVAPAPEADMLIDLDSEQPTAPPMRTEQPAQPGLADFMQVLTKSSTFNKDSTLAETIVPMCQLMVIWCDPAISLPDKVQAMMGFVQTLAAKLNGSS